MYSPSRFCSFTFLCRPWCVFVPVLMLLITANAFAQTSTRISVNSQANLLLLNQETSVEIKLTDLRGNSVLPREGAYLTITVSVLDDLASAKKNGEWRKVNSLVGESLVLKASRDGATTNDANVLQGPFPSRQNSFTFRFRSERAGKLRLSAEGSGMITGSAEINVQGPSRIGITINQSTVRARTEATVELALLDYQWRPAQAPTDLKMTVTATTFERLSDAQRAGEKPVSRLENALLALPQNPATVRLSGLFPKGRDRVKLRLRADFAGVIRIFCEGYGLATGSAMVATVAMTVRPALNRDEQMVASFFQPVSFLPAAWQQPQVRGKLQIARIDSATSTNRAVRERQFQVVFVPDADSEVKVPPADLKVDFAFSYGNEGKVKATIEPSPLIIHANTVQSEMATLYYACKGEVNLIARTELPDVRSSLTTEFDFSPNRHAAILTLNASPSEGVANGLRPITLTATTWDTCGAQIRTADESLDMGGRIVQFEYEGHGFINFEGGEKTLKIPAEKSWESKKIFSTQPIDKQPIKAKTFNINDNEIRDEAIVSFYLPAKEFAASVLGGFLFSLVLQWLKQLATTNTPQIRSLAERKKARLQTILELVIGAFMGAITFGGFFFGAMITDEASLGSLKIKLLSLPTDNWMAALILGFIGAFLTLGSWWFLFGKNKAAGTDKEKIAV